MSCTAAFRSAVSARSRAWVFAATLLIGSLLTGPVTAREPSPSSSPATPPAAAQFDVGRATQWVNSVRERVADCNQFASLKPVVATASAAPQVRPQVRWNPVLARAAQAHSDAMAHERFFDHIDPRGQTVGKRATAAGYRWRAVGENIAAGHRNLDEAFGGWLQSLEHCRNMIDPRFTEFGLARTVSPHADDEYSEYWTLVMGAPKP